MTSMIRDFEVDEAFSPAPSRYDQFNAGLIASIIVFGFLFSCLAVVWYFGDDPQFRNASVLVYPGELDERDGNVEEQDFDEIVKGANSSDLQSILESVEDAVSQLKSGEGLDGKGILSMPGIRDPGPAPSQKPANRWKIAYEIENRLQYKKQLDQLGIEIGVLHSRDNDIWRIGALATDGRVSHSSRERERLSMMFAHSKPVLKQWDRGIATDAGLKTEGMLFVQFFPENLINQIAELEAAKLKELGKELGDVRTTNIAFQRAGEHFSISISGFVFR